MALSVSIEFVSSSARVTSVKFAKVAHSLSELVREKQTHRSDPRPGSDKKMKLARNIYFA